jgi:hypothetical protein
MITEEQRSTIRELLTVRGLTFKPLQMEMVDHICCDIEAQMARGISFDEALQTTIGEIPEDHFINIQTETMETIQKRFTLSQWLSYMALGFLLCSVIFKILHLQFGEHLLLLSFCLIAASLLTSSVSGIYLNRGKKGALRVLAVVVGVTILLLGYSFKLLHLPGADQIIWVAIIVIIPALVVNTVFVYRHATGEGNLLTFLHEKYTPGIERFLLFLLLPITLYKVIKISGSSEDQFVGGLVLLIVIFGAGLQFIALSWRTLEREAIHRNPSILAGIIISFLCLVLLFLGNVIPLEVRIVMIPLYSVASAWLALKMEQTKTISSLISAYVVPLLFCCTAMLQLGIIPMDAKRFIFNLPVLILLTIGLFLCKKNDLMRTYMIVSLSSYVFEYVN